MMVNNGGPYGGIAYGPPDQYQHQRFPCPPPQPPQYPPQQYPPNVAPVAANQSQQQNNMHSNVNQRPPPPPFVRGPLPPPVRTGFRNPGRYINLTKTLVFMLKLTMNLNFCGQFFGWRYGVSCSFLFDCTLFFNAIYHLI